MQQIYIGKNPVPKIKLGSSNTRMRQSSILKIIQESLEIQKGKCLCYKVTVAIMEVFRMSAYSYWKDR